MSAATAGPVALQHCSQFVGRTTNWLYDHLRVIPRYTPLVLCESLRNRDEFPELEAWCPDHGMLRRIWRQLSGGRLYPWELRRLRRLAPCVLHSHFGGIAVLDYALQRSLDVPWIVGFYGADAYSPTAQAKVMYPRIFDQAAQVLALGPVMKARLAQLGCPEDKVTIHPLGVDVEHLPYEPRELKPDEPLRILFAGTFREKKGIRYVIEAAAHAQRAGIRFELQLVGNTGGKASDRETKEAVFGLIQRLELEAVVTHRPFLRFQELIALALRCHVFVAPSVAAADGDAEGTPFVLQQMMATGMPAIATAHSDIPYVFGEHAHLLVPERDAVAIADRLQRYVDDPDTLVTDGTALRDRVRCAFDVRQCAARLSDLYDKLQ